MTKKPSYRFAGYTESWEQRKLGEISSRVKGNDGRMDLPTLTISAGQGWLDQRERFSGNIAGKEQKNYTLLRKGELSYNHGNSKLAKYGVVFQLNNYTEALVPKVYHSFKMIDGRSGTFFEYLFATKIPDRELGKLVSSGARMDGLLNITYDDFMSIKLTFPTLPEQTAIGSFFQDIDQLISLQQRKLEVLKEQKKTYLKLLFPAKGQTKPALRFAGFEDEWKEVKLGEIADYKNGKGYEDRQSDSGSYELINLNSISIDGGLKRSGKFIDKVDETLEKGDLVMVLSDVAHGNLLGRVAIIPESNKFVLNQRVALLRPRLNSNSEFLYSYINSNQYYFKAQGAGMSQLNISRSSVENFSVYFPSLPEQEAIGAFFQDLDKAIAKQEEKVNQLKESKQTLLRKMFI